MIVRCGTSNHRQMFYKPNVVPLCGILLFLVFYFSPELSYFEVNQKMNKTFSEVNNDQFIGSKHRFEIWEDGTIIIHRLPVTNLNDLPQMIADFAEESKDKECISILAHEGTEFKYIQSVLKASQKAGIYKVFLITNTCATPLTYILEQNARQTAHR